ncbi:hypothetical protein F4775DRAFT_565624 [Biscogniauxia sp. FL1348]|nr:hypothetical protein F4775DRAFT_565624 [Biscogniauxia sp. FL1348]
MASSLTRLNPPASSLPPLLPPTANLGTLAALPPELIRLILLDHADLRTLARFAAVNRLARSLVILLLPRCGAALRLLTSALSLLYRMDDPFDYVVGKVAGWGYRDAVRVLLEDAEGDDKEKEKGRGRGCCVSCGQKTDFVSPRGRGRVCRGCQGGWRRRMGEGEGKEVLYEIYFTLPRWKEGRVRTNLCLDSDAGVYMLDT